MRRSAFLNGYAACLTAVRDFESVFDEAVAALSMDDREAMLRAETKNDTLIAEQLRRSVERSKAERP